MDMIENESKEKTKVKYSERNNFKNGYPMQILQN